MRSELNCVKSLCDLKALCDEFRTSIEYYENAYNDALNESHNIPEFNNSQYDALDEAEILFDEYNQVLDRTGTPASLFALIEENNQRRSEYEYAKNMLREKVESLEVSSMIQSMRDFNSAIESIKYSL